MGFTGTFIFKWMCRAAFKKIDVNKNGVLEGVELSVAIYELYNLLNKRLPGWSDPPSQSEVQQALKLYDADGNGVLDVDEFIKFAEMMMKDGPDKFFTRISKNAMLKTTIMPAGAHFAQKSLVGTIPSIGGIPTSVLAPAIGVVGGIIRFFVPI